MVILFLHVIHRTPEAMLRLIRQSDAESQRMFLCLKLARNIFNVDAVNHEMLKAMHL